LGVAVNFESHDEDWSKIAKFREEFQNVV
jgi:hypothetical protein